MENKQLTYGSLIRRTELLLAPVYGGVEAKAMTRLIFYHLKGWNLTDMVVNADIPAPDYVTGKVEGIIQRLETGEPLQYILGEAYFYGMNLNVTPATLIPRPETAELIDMIVHRFRASKDLRILDIGTGSGAIAIALSRNLPFADVSAIDISKEAIDVALENAEILKAHVSFKIQDIFKWTPTPHSLDIIVSNPPYIDESEKRDMERNVLDFEPHTALFVPDDDPLLFYREIAIKGKEALVSGGSLFFEINPRHANEMKELLDEEGYFEIEIHKDISGKQRFISASRP